MLHDSFQINLGPRKNSMNLLILFDTLAGHSVNDRITSRIHVPHEHTEPGHDQDQHNHNEGNHGKGLVEIGSVLMRQFNRTFSIQTLLKIGTKWMTNKKSWLTLHKLILIS